MSEVSKILEKIRNPKSSLSSVSKDFIAKFDKMSKLTSKDREDLEREIE